MRFLWFFAMIVSAVAQYTDVLTRGNVAPVEVINFAIESATPDALTERRIAEARRAEAAQLATISRQRSSAESALQSLLAAEKLHNAAVDDILG